MNPGLAGNWVQLTISLSLSIGWVSTYFYRIATKNMTYVSQLRDYEDAVMAKRLEEIPETDLENLIADIQKDKETLREKRRSLF